MYRSNDMNIWGNLVYHLADIIWYVSYRYKDTKERFKKGQCLLLLC